MKKIAFFSLLILSGTVACSTSKDGAAEEGGPVLPADYPEEVESYNYAIGTQTIGPSYGFTEDTRLVETAKQILEMGSNIMKTTLSLAPGYEYCDRMLEQDESYRAILEMDFRYYFFWVYSSVDTAWTDGLSEEEKDAEYENMYRLADYLLKTFDGSGKEFFLGHWEGDWHLTDTDGNVQTVDKDRIRGMIDWYDVRQKAVDDAKAANPDSDVEVWHYSEVNRVMDALDKGYDRIVNKVLPETDVDYVSYSSYDAISSDTYGSLSETLHRALNAIAGALKPKAGIEGKRVFIGEYGFSFRTCGATDQNLRSRMVMKAALEWGCPFVLYWEMYNNEIGSDGSQTGFWLINDKGVKQPVWYTHYNFYNKMKGWVWQYLRDNGSLPSREVFNEEACKNL